MAPVLMYLPRLDLLLAPGHPGRVALESLLPAEGTSWLDSILPHCARSQPKWLNLGRRLDQAGHGWLHGQSLWTRPRIRALDLHRDDGRLGVGHVGATPAPQVNKKEGACEQRPLIEGTILEWNQAASALHYGLVNACVPAAEALLQMLLPAWHPSRKYKTSVLAPYAIWQGLVVRRAEVVRFQARSRSFPRDGEAHRPG